MNQIPRCIEEISREEIDEILSSKPAILVGSAISMFPPTDLSSGKAFVKGLFSHIFSDSIYQTGQIDWLLKEFDNMPFESVMECYPQQEKLPGILQSIFCKDDFNAYHESLCHKLTQEVFHTIITPNYDLAFDKILTGLNFTNIIYREPKDFVSAPCLFKIHGSAERHAKDTLVFTLKQEQDLHGWKVKLLTRLIENRHLIIIGYSGRDFDICPIIKKANCKGVLWVERNSNELTAYQKLLTRSNDRNEIVRGDFSRFLNHFFGEPIILAPSHLPFTTQEYFSIGDIERLRWQMHILDRMACATFIGPLLNKLKGKIDESIYLNYESRYYSHIGKYAKAAKNQLKRIKFFPKDSKEYIHTLLNISGSWLGHYSFNKANRYLSMAKEHAEKHSMNDDEIQLAINNSEFTLRSKKQMVFKYLQSVQKKRLEDLKEEIDKLRNVASLDARQGARLNLQRMGFSSELAVLSGYEGFKNLGLPGMALIAYRQKFEKNDWDVDETPLAELDKCIDKAERLGMSTELWKHYKIKFRNQVLPSSVKLGIWKKWRKNLKVSEYGFLRFYPERIQLYLALLGPGMLLALVKSYLKKAALALRYLFLK